MGLIELLRANAEFVADGVPPPVAGARANTLVIADSGPGLGGMLERALGLKPGQAVVIQLNGAWGGREGQELMRSVVHGLHVHGCSEIVVVACDVSALSIERERLRETRQRLSIASDSADGEQLSEMARGPSNPRAGMLDTVRLLRNSRLVPSDVPVHGCQLERSTGLLKVLDQDRSQKTGQKAVQATAGTLSSMADAIPDIPLPVLPEIPLPEIPELDLDNLGAAGPAEKKEKKQKKKRSGRKGSGPVSMEEIQKIAPKDLPQPIMKAAAIGLTGITTAEVNFQVPEAAVIQDTGMGGVDAMLPAQPSTIPEWAEVDFQAKQDVAAVQDVAAAKQVAAKQDVAAKLVVRREKQAKKKTPQVKRPKPAPVRKPERPMVTPIVGQGQVPLGERVLDFKQAEAKTPPPQKKPKPAGTRVDIQAGYVAKDGAEFPLDPELQRALLKVGRFLANEFASVDRNQMLGRIRRAAKQGQQPGELLKLMIGPVLKLGKKRYAVINELLKVKEELPRQAPDVALAILAEILTGA
jgi:carbonic anhydrase